MPFALLIIGALLLISAVRGTSDQLFALVSGDFTQPPGFAYWMVAILIIGSIGYIPKVKPISVAFLWLLVLVLFLSKGDPTKVGGGFFTQFVQGLQSTTTSAGATSTAATGTATANVNPISSLGISQSNPFGSAAQIAGTPAGIPGVSHTDLSGNVVSGSSTSDQILKLFNSVPNVDFPMLTVN